MGSKDFTLNKKSSLDNNANRKNKNKFKGGYLRNT